MTNSSIAEKEIETLRERIEELRSSLTPLERKKIELEEACGKHILDEYSEDIAEALQQSPDCDFVLIYVECGARGEIERIDITFSGRKMSDIAESDALCFQAEGKYFYVDGCNLPKRIKGCSSNFMLPVVIRWGYTDSYVNDYLEEDVHFQPVQYEASILRPYIPPAPVTKVVRTSQPRKQMVCEKNLEEDLLKWIRSRGIDAENQIATSKHRMDVWILGKCFMELKKGKVNGDDVCQSIDYCAEYQLPVIIVGSHINEMASRSIEAFNKAVDSDMLTFVQWSAVKTYLKGLFSNW
jgi:hypothetical protein